jgi:hypothetical protein
MDLMNVKVRPFMTGDRDDYSCHFSIGQEYAIYTYGSEYSNIQKGWHKFMIKYIRLNVLFIEFDCNPGAEYWLLSNSILSGQLIPLEVNLVDYNISDEFFDPLVIVKDNDFPYEIKIRKNSNEIIVI